MGSDTQHVLMSCHGCVSCVMVYHVLCILCMCHIACVMTCFICHVSCVMCHVSCTMYHSLQGIFNPHIRAGMVRLAITCHLLTPSTSTPSHHTSKTSQRDTSTAYRHDDKDVMRTQRVTVQTSPRAASRMHVMQTSPSQRETQMETPIWATLDGTTQTHGSTLITATSAPSHADDQLSPLSLSSSSAPTRTSILPGHM